MNATRILTECSPRHASLDEALACERCQMAARSQLSKRRAKPRGMSGHQKPNRGKTDTWLTPPEVIATLGPFDLDPCAAPDPRPWPTAARHIAWPNDGLFAEWTGRVWLNPPYGRATGAWLKRLADHGSGVALVFARTETEDWHRHIWPRATAILFPQGRFTFCRADGSRADHNGGAPSALVAYSEYDAERLGGSNIDGWTIRPPNGLIRRILSSASPVVSPPEPDHVK